MIYDVFLPFVIIFSIFSIIIILARKIPDISLEPEVKKDLIAEKAIKQHRAMVLFCKILSILEKILRQLRIHILKLDAKIFGAIQYLRDKSAKKLEEINKLSYKNFVPVAEKKANNPQIAVKMQYIEKEILPSAPIKTPNHSGIGFAQKKIKPSERPDKISTKHQLKIDERKLLQIIAKNPKNAENYKKLGMFYNKNENFPDAEAAFNEYLKLNSSDNEVKEILKRVILKNQGEKF